MTTVSFQPTAHDQPYPESPCNVDALIDLPGYGPVVKVTGRGITPREAVTNFHQTVLELRAMAAAATALEPRTRTQPAPEPSALTLESLLTTELGKAVASQDDTLALALAKAARLVNHDAVRPTDTPAAYTVDSATDTTRAYAVSDGICACVDYVKRAHRLHAYCVHTLAVDFYARLSESL